jgi:hypothetical protein
MNLNTFKDIIDLTKKRCNIADTTEFDDIISTALNNVYVELSKKEPEISYTMIASINGTAYLPDDLFSIIKLKPDLNTGEYRLGNNLIVSKDREFELTYSVVPELLTDSDIPALPKKYFYPMSTYGCYAYYNYKKKPDAAQAYMYEYQKSLSDLSPADKTHDVIQNVYGGLYANE